jgi:hypothetical protein
MDDLQDQASTREIVEYSSQDLGSMVENIAGENGMMAWIDESNEHDPEFLFPDDSDEDEDDVVAVGEDEVEESSSSEEEESSSGSDEEQSNPIFRYRAEHGRPKRNAGSYKDGPARYDRRKLSFLVK